MAPLRFPDDPVAQAVHEANHAYRWGKADCLTVLARAYDLATGDDAMDVTAWHSLSHAAAVRAAVRKNGSILAAYDELMLPYMDGVDAVEDADLVVLTRPHSTVAGVGFDPLDSGGAVLAFRTGAGEVWCYGPHGLAQVLEPIVAARHWRLRRSA